MGVCFFDFILDIKNKFAYNQPVIKQRKEKNANKNNKENCNEKSIFEKAG